MAREILFKAKKIDNGEWVEGSLINAKNYTCILDNNTDDMYYPYLDGDLGIIDGRATPIIPETICQYTGLTDKNGNKIWENDVVGFLDVSAYDNGYSEYYCRGQVMWDEDTLSFEVTERFSCESYEALGECEVIGNIFDNKELLEGTPVNGYADQCGLMSAT